MRVCTLWCPVAKAGLGIPQENTYAAARPFLGKLGIGKSLTRTLTHSEQLVLMEMDGTQDDYDELLRQNARPGPSHMMDKRGSEDAVPEDWCDSGLDSFGGVGPSFEANFTYIEAEPRGAPERSVLGVYTPDESVNKSAMDYVSIGGGERLDSAIGDSINDDAVVGCLSEGIGTMILSEPAGTDILSGSKPEVDRKRMEELLNTMNFLSEDGDSVLQLAVIHEQWPIVNCLLEEISLYSNWIVYLDIQNDLGQTALHLAVIVDQSECVRALLCNGAASEIQDRGGNTPFHLAVREHRTECVRELTSCSRTLPEHLNITNFSGMSALHTAVQKGNCDIIKMLLDAGADANQRDLGSGRSPLHMAVEGQRSAVVGLLLSAGSVVNQRSYAGHSPLYLALYRPNKEVQALLSASGATYTREDEEEEENRESEEEEFDDVVINGQRVM
ncbi:NF-kappa-B inhibitor epsilon [Triplophysa tibetana]|uniref:NF-kappa-B inhibitor alpha n=1 Tax=Triplophysa tibetana TaxID=1572043 RepID=A0A5A9P5L2_9TELE|nr:NF-kappa-B inhibitor epsilon [Triplophysa tibetana]